MKDKHLKGWKYYFSLRTVKFLNVLMIASPIVAAWFGYYAYNQKLQITGRKSLVIIALFVMIYIILGKAYSAFLVSYNRISEMFLGQMIAILIADAIIFVILWINNWMGPSIWPFLLALSAQLLLSLIWCFSAHKWYFHTFPPSYAAIIYDQREGLENLLKEYGLDKKYDVKLVMNVHSCLEDLTVLKDVQTVFLSGVHSHERNIILKYCVENDISGLIIPRIGDVIMSGAHQMHMFHLPMLRVERFFPNLEYLLAKRFLDILLSGILLILLSPLFLIIAIAIKLQDHGPVFYKQVRLTKDRKEFKIIKFRSMKVDAEKDGVAKLFSGENDERITKVGRLIRRYRLDEIPQFINILKGDMSFVGPRPERPEIAEQYEKEIPEFKLRLQVKAGLTGYAQVYGKYNTSPYDKLLMDLTYIANPGIRHDLVLFFSTIKTLFLPESTEGIAAGKITAMDFGRTDSSAEDKKKNNQ